MSALQKQIAMTIKVLLDLQLNALLVDDTVLFKTVSDTIEKLASLCLAMK